MAIRTPTSLLSPAGAAVLACLVAPAAGASPWQEDPVFLADGEGWPASEVDAADLDGDGRVDLVFANGGGVFGGGEGTARPLQAFHNDGAAMIDVGAAVFGGATYEGRAVKARDLDGDGDVDVVLGTTWETQSQLFLNAGDGTFTNVTASHLPAALASVGDIEVGDVDGDGDLDLVLTDWGPDTPVDLGAGGISRLWLQAGSPAGDEPGSAMFADATRARMPPVPVRWAWDHELVDVDNDWDLDLVTACFACADLSVLLFVNDGAGTFADATATVTAQGRFALDVEAMDLDDDGALDLVTLHDGPGGRDRVLLGDGAGGFVDDTPTWWPDADNPPSLDVMAAFLDDDGDGAADLVIGARDGGTGSVDRLLVSGGGALHPVDGALNELTPSDGTYAVVLADFDQDDRLDVAMAQNEDAFQKKVLLGGGEVDATPPRVTHVEAFATFTPPTAVLRVRCHDHKSPLMLHDFDGADGRPYVETWMAEPADPDAEPGERSAPGRWYGEYLWRVAVDLPDVPAIWFRVCAVDAAGNRGCTPVERSEQAAGTESLSESEADSNPTDSTSRTDSAADPSDGTAGSSGGAPTSSGATGTGSMGASETVGTGGLDELGCDCASAPASAWLGWLVLVRRRRRARSGR